MGPINRRIFNPGRMVLLSMVLGAVTSSVQASTLVFATGFEPPIYTVGPLAGQDGWATGGTVDVEDVLVLSDTQSVAITADSAGVQALRPTPVDTTVNPIVIMQADLLFAGNPTTWIFGAAGGAFNTLGGVSIQPDGSLQALTAGSPSIAGPISPITIYTFDVLYDFSADTFSVFVNGTAAFANEPFLDSSNTQFLTGFLASDGGGGLSLLDNYSVTASELTQSPEPSSAVLWIIGFSLLGFSLIQRSRLRAARSSIS